MSNIRNYDKYKHLIGTKINEWTILDVLCYPDKPQTFLLVQCSCGKIVELPLTDITKNYKTDCGCMHRKRLDQKVIEQYKYLIGTKINNWTVLKIIPPNENCRKTMALCRCQCGTIKKVRIQYLLDGRSRDWGCGRKKTLRETRTKNLVGQRFGKLVVKELLEESDDFNRRRYLCNCDCGGKTITSSICLTSGHTKSCGCLTSYYNMYIDQFLNEIHIDHETEFPVVIDGVRYRFDFYLPDYNLFIEYDGEQHFKPTEYHGNDFEANMNDLLKRQKYDQIKNKYCEDNNINLLRIPYWEKENVESIINNHLQRLSEKGFAA